MKKLLCISLFATGYWLLATNIHAQSPTPVPPEVIYPQNSNFCSDFMINYEDTRDGPTIIPTPSTSDVLGTTREFLDVSGKFEMKEAVFLDFSLMKDNITSATEKLLPQELNEKLNIQEKTFSSEVKHFVVGTTEGTPAPPTPAKSNVTMPDWWSNLLGQTKITCGFFGTCQAPQSMEITFADTDQTVKDYSYQIGCTGVGGGSNVKTSLNPSATETEKEFRTKSFFEWITEFIQNLFTRETEKTVLTDKTRGQVPGGKSFQTFSDFQRAFIPQEMMDEWEIKTGADINQGQFQSTINSPKFGGSKTDPERNEQIFYADMEKEKFKRCITLCAIYPDVSYVSNADPMCTSCDPKDYKIDYIEVNKANCHLIGNEGCDYYTCMLGETYTDPITQEVKVCQKSCDGDPTCESGKCYHHMYRMNNDYAGCPRLPYNASGCTIKEICVPMTFKKNSGGGFGPCQYTNPNVCVRADWKDSGIGMCDNLCNWACCQYQNQ